MNLPIIAIDARLMSTTNTGDTSYWNGLVSGLSELEDDFKILLYSNNPDSAMVPDDPRFSAVHLPQTNSRVWSLRDFPFHAASSGAQLLHTQYNVSPISPIPCVTTVHDVSFFINPKWFRLKDRLILKSRVPASVKLASHVFTVSQTSKLEIERFIPAAQGKISVTYNALGKNIKPIEKKKAAEIVKENLGIDSPFLFTLGTKWPRKNIELAIQAASNLPESIPHKLVVTGQDGWGHLPDHSRTHFTGYISNELVSALYSAADIYLAPSWHEGFGIPLLEAFACQCPVICSPGGALPEVAANAAVVAPDFEPTTWSKLIQDLLLDETQVKSLQQLGQKRLQDFSWKESAKLTLEGYKKALS